MFVVAAWVSSWGLGLGHFVLDRYLFYLVPVLLLGFLCALLDRRRPRWSLLAPIALVAAGFLTHFQGAFTWSTQFPLNTDSPIATLYRPIVRWGGGTGGAGALLVGATVVAAALFLLADRLLRPAQVTMVFTALLLVAFPLNTWHTFRQLFSTNGHSGRPLTRSESGILDWLDRAVGTDAAVTMIPYPVSTSFIDSQAFWRDLEFWNKSVRYSVHYPTPFVYADALIWFPKSTLGFDARTGAVAVPQKPQTPYVVQSVGETRFRIDGPVQIQRPDVMLIRATVPWRADWLTFGLYGDGWTQPRVPARIRVFPVPGQKGAVVRTLSLQVRTPPDVPRRGFEVESNLGALHAEATSDENASVRIELCVPSDRFSEVRVSTPEHSSIPGGLQSLADSLLPREGGVLIADISVADEIGGPCRPKARRAG